MKFINVRELHNKTAQVLGIVAKGDRVIVTYRGKPCAAIVPLFEEELEAFILKNRSIKKKTRSGSGTPPDPGSKASHAVNADDAY